jgi:hypothetical protein
MRKNYLTPLWGALLLFAAGALFCGDAQAVGAFKIVPIGAAGSGTTVALTTHSWTAVPTTSSLAWRSGVNIAAVGTDAAVLCTLNPSSPSEAVTTGDIYIPANTDRWIYTDNNMKVYCVSLHTSTENVNVKEYR